MWIPSKFFDKTVQMYESLMCFHRKDVESGLSKILESKQNELAYLLKIKDEEIAFLKEQVKSYSKLVDHERARAEAAIDRLIVREANVPPVANADLARTQGEKDISVAEERVRKAKELETVFAQANEVGEDFGKESPMEKFSDIGGFTLESS